MSCKTVCGLSQYTLLRKYLYHPLDDKLFFILFFMILHEAYENSMEQSLSGEANGITKFTAFCRTEVHFHVRKNSHLFLSWADLIKSTFSQPVSLRYILILFYSSVPRPSSWPCVCTHPCPSPSHPTIIPITLVDWRIFIKMAWKSC
jgi:hypothetical protein